MSEHAKLSFSGRAEGALRIAKTLIGRIGAGRKNDLHCHELVRAVQSCLREAGNPRARVVDGRMGSIDHSWVVLPDCTLQTGFNLPPILDVWAPGRRPQVQLIDASWIISADYVEGQERLDVRHDVVQVLVREMSPRQTPSPAKSRACQVIDLAIRCAVQDMGVLNDLAPDLLRKILAATDELQQRFGWDTRLSLSSPDGERLVLIVDPQRALADVHDQMTDFLREWWWPRILVADRISVRLRRIQSAVTTTRQATP